MGSGLLTANLQLARGASIRRLGELDHTRAASRAMRWAAIA
jgi:hypothetical protein